MFSLTALNPYMIWIKIAGFTLALIAAGAATHYVDANVYGNKIAAIQLEDQKQKTADITASLSQLQGFIASMHNADAGYNDELAHIDSQFANLKKGLSNALRTPLPADCKPDVGRVQSLHAALDAANAHPAAGK